MYSIIPANPYHLNDIFKKVIELARYHGLEDRIKITEKQLGELLFCDKPNHFAGLAMIDDTLSGLVLFNVTNHNVCVHVNPGIYIENLYVLPEYRKQGIGKALFRYVVQKSLENNCSLIEWWVSRDNNTAAEFYKKLGAQELSEWTIFKCDKLAMENLLAGAAL